MTHTVTLVHITPNAEELISYMARVSNPANQNNTQTSARLIKYLIDHNHWSPFEMVNMCVSIETTRSIAAQILRHRSFSFQEFSQRYAEVTLRPEIPELRRQDTKNRQNSIDDLEQD
jgi:thymidylate synthase (FAD)